MTSEEEATIRNDERAWVVRVLREMDKEYDSLYLWCCDAGSVIGAAQAAGKRMAVSDLLKKLGAKS